MGKIFPPQPAHVRQHKRGRWASAASRLGAFHFYFRYLGIPLRFDTPQYHHTTRRGEGPTTGGGFQFTYTGGAAGPNCFAHSHTSGALV